ncbi:putative dehydrogenase [Breznakia blatticola]|uniref:Putative dehydrogenase n=1 Tax=Breznakia blatticola TaxID=1754012 RepID=A0A4R7ZBY6_9FIRM|nr:Gfo/Idh/MocA family oxidoreductase [Breznakia blatticola]TDW08856.1 putative dehydrogenase [Breznakia blatticola]
MKIGTIGRGAIVDRFIKAISMTDHVELVAVYSRKLDDAKAYAAQHQVDAYYDSIDAMLADETVDTVYVASPNSLHYEQSLQALHAKKNVICEKPFTSTLAETEHLIAVAKANNVFLFEAITTIHLPNYEVVRNQLPNLGNMKMATLNFSQYSSRYDKYKDQIVTNAFDPNFSGGALMDINIYNIHFVMGLFGKPESYTYYPNIGFNGIDTSGTLIMRYDTFTVNCIGCKDCSSDYFTLLQGDNGSVKVSGGSTGVCPIVEKVPLKGDQIDVANAQDNPNCIGVNQHFHMAYEVDNFQKIIEANDFEACYKLLDHTRDVMDVVYHARLAAGITFPVDKD